MLGPCLPLLLGKTSSPSDWILPKPSQPGLFSSPLALYNFKHASVPCAHTRNLSAATASPWGDTFGTVLFPHVKDMWSWKMAKNPTEMAVGGQVLIQMSHHSLIPSVTHINLAHGTAQRDGLENSKCKSVHQYDREPLENVHICLEDLHVNVHVISNLLYTVVAITARNTSQLFSLLTKSAVPAWLLSGWGQFSVSWICISSKAEQYDWLHLVVNK